MREKYFKKLSFALLISLLMSLLLLSDDSLSINVNAKETKTCSTIENGEEISNFNSLDSNQSFKSKKKTKESKAVVTQQKNNNDENSVDYIANKNTKKFHYPSCSSVDDMKEKNKWYYNGDRQGLIDKGYVPCKRCNP